MKDVTQVLTDHARAIIEGAAERIKKEREVPITGEATDLSCLCGGVLHRRELPEPPLMKKRPRWHRKARIRKKQFKRWLEETRIPRMLHIMMMAAKGPHAGFRCAKCKRIVGMYEAISRNAFKIEPMPEGALPIYERDPEVATLVVEGDEPK